MATRDIVNLRMYRFHREGFSDAVEGFIREIYFLGGAEVFFLFVFHVITETYWYWKKGNLYYLILFNAESFVKRCIY